MRSVPGRVNGRNALTVAALLLLSILPAAAQSLNPQAGEIEVEGQVTAVDRASHHLTLSVTSITQPGHAALVLPTARPKPILFSADTSFAAGYSPEQIQVGSSLQVVGKDLGPGKELPARAIVLTSAGAGELDIQGPGNLARLAKVTASRCEGNTTPDGLTDGIIGGYPHDRSQEWSSGQREGASVTLAWDTPQTIDTVALYNRAGGGDAVTAGEMTFEDGGKVEFGKLPDDPKTPLLVCFLPRPVRTLTITITGVRAGTYSAGFSEVAVFHTGKVDSSTPNLSPVARQLTLQEKLQAILDWDKAHPWNETIDWNKMDRLTCQLAPNRLDWNQLCIEATGRPLSSFGDALPPQDADRFLDCLIGHIKGIVARDGSKLTEMEWAILGCSVVPLQNGGRDNFYFTSDFSRARLGAAIAKTPKGTNCGDSSTLTTYVLLGLGIQAECVEVVQKGGDHLHHMLVNFVEHNRYGIPFGHLADPVNCHGTDLGAGMAVYRPVRDFEFQLGGSRRDRVQLLRKCGYYLLAVSREFRGVEPFFTPSELESPELRSLVEAGLRIQVVDAKLPRVAVPLNTIITYRAVAGVDFPDRQYPFVLMETLGVDNKWHLIWQTGNHLGPSEQHGNIVTMTCDIEGMGFGTGYYRARFYLAGGSTLEDFNRHRDLVGFQEIAYGVPAKR